MSLDIMSELPTLAVSTLADDAGVQYIDFRCLICGSQECSVQKFVFSSENNSFSDSFCKLYRIQSRTHRLDILDIFEDSFFCSQCHQELSCIQTLHSQIEKLKDEIQRIKNSCDLKLKELNPSPTPNLLEAETGTTDSFGDEIRKKRTRLLKYSRISNLKSKAPSPSSESSATLEDGETKKENGNYSPLYSTEGSLVGQDVVHLDFDYVISSFDFGALDIDDAEAEIKNVSAPSHIDSEKEVKVRKTNSDNFDELGKQYRLKELSIRINRVQVEANTSTTTLTKKRNSKRTIIREARRLNLPYACPHPGCIQRYSTELERNGHVKRAHEGISHPFECSICSHKYSSYAKFKDHSNTHNGLLPYKCSSPTCDKTFPMKTTMLQHLRIVHGSTDHRCDKCGSRFSAKHLLISHMRSHTTAKEFECDICQKSFRQKDTLKNHRFTHPELNLTETKCRFCDKVLAGRYYLKIHERSHTGELPFKCSVCHVAYGLQSRLNRHMVRHIVEKEFVCGFCKHTFKNQTALKAHIKLYHPSSKDFTCAECGKSFGCKIYLNIHEEIHKEIKRLLCPLCGKSFAQATSYKYHMRHTHHCQNQDADESMPS